MNLQRPSAEQCCKNEKVHDDECHVGYAIWYPQMGGYVGCAIAVFPKDPEDRDPCIDVYIWHDGEFPFDNDRQPAIIHHCSADQFISFGNTLKHLISDRG
jgi:hypothetical protein